MHLPPLETARLIIRPFTADDLEAAHRILDLEHADTNTGTAGAQTLEQRRSWLEWSVMNYEHLAWMYQPPYGDRAVALKDTGELIGAAGFVPAMGPFGLLPSLRGGEDLATARLNVPEFGLYWEIAPAHQRRGYATEAARALIEYALGQLNLKRIIATTSNDNVASIAVMRKAGMRIERNPEPEPEWFQVVGILENTTV
jgi:[ribosomal protein S5]-alanine N-acetyltransferase